MGTPDLARTVLSRLADGMSPWGELVGVVAQPDKPVGRGLQMQAPPVKQEALARGLEVAQPSKARDPEFLRLLHRMAPDVIVVAAYGQLLPPDLLAIPRFGCLNVHTSLLPRWRGAAPIQWAILEGDTETGITLMRMDAGLDTGDILAMERTAVRPDDTGQILHDRLAVLGGDLLIRTLPDWLEGRITPRPQGPQGVTYARKLTREDGRLDWRRPAAVLERQIRALNPWPGAWTHVVEPESAPWLLKVWRASVEPCSGSPGEILRASGDELLVAAGAGTGSLRLLEVQREGRKRIPTRDFLAGQAFEPGRYTFAVPGSS